MLFGWNSVHVGASRVLARPGAFPEFRQYCVFSYSLRLETSCQCIAAENAQTMRQSTDPEFEPVPHFARAKGGTVIYGLCYIRVEGKKVGKPSWAGKDV